MIAQFITPSESRLREKSFSRNAEQVRSPSLISLLLDAGAYERRPLIYVVAHGCSTGVAQCVRTGVVRCVRTGVAQCVRTGVVRCVRTGVIRFRFYRIYRTMCKCPNRNTYLITLSNIYNEIRGVISRLNNT